MRGVAEESREEPRQTGAQGSARERRDDGRFPEGGRQGRRTQADASGHAEVLLETRTRTEERRVSDPLNVHLPRRRNDQREGSTNQDVRGADQSPREPATQFGASSHVRAQTELATSEVHTSGNGRTWKEIPNTQQLLDLVWSENFKNCWRRNRRAAHRGNWK